MIGKGGAVYMAFSSCCRYPFPLSWELYWAIIVDHCVIIFLEHGLLVICRLKYVLILGGRFFCDVFKYFPVFVVVVRSANNMK